MVIWVGRMQGFNALACHTCAGPFRIDHRKASRETETSRKKRLKSGTLVVLKVPSPGPPPPVSSRMLRVPALGQVRAVQYRRNLYPTDLRKVQAHAKHASGVTDRSILRSRYGDSCMTGRALRQRDGAGLCLSSIVCVCVCVCVCVLVGLRVSSSCCCRFDVGEMGDFIRSPEFAGTLRRCLTGKRRAPSFRGEQPFLASEATMWRATSAFHLSCGLMWRAAIRYDNSATARKVCGGAGGRRPAFLTLSSKLRRQAIYDEARTAHTGGPRFFNKGCAMACSVQLCIWQLAYLTGAIPGSGWALNKQCRLQPLGPKSSGAPKNTSDSSLQVFPFKAEPFRSCTPSSSSTTWKRWAPHHRRRSKAQCICNFCRLNRFFFSHLRRSQRISRGPELKARAACDPGVELLVMDPLL